MCNIHLACTFGVTVGSLGWASAGFTPLITQRTIEADAPETPGYGPNHQLKLMLSTLARGPAGETAACRYDS
jgi:hypothetical protein